MPLISLSAEEKAAALQAASPDLKYHLSEVGAPVDVQAALYSTTRVLPPCACSLALMSRGWRFARRLPLKSA